MEALLVGLIWLLVYALIIGVVCYIITRIVAQFFPAGAGFTWIIWCIGGLILLILIIRLLTSTLPGLP